MPTTRTVLMMLLSRYSEPPCSPEHKGTIVEGAGLLRNHTIPAHDQGVKVQVPVSHWKDRSTLQEMSEGFGTQVSS